VCRSRVADPSDDIGLIRSQFGSYLTSAGGVLKALFMVQFHAIPVDY